MKYFIAMFLLMGMPLFGHVVFYHMQSTYAYECEYLLIGCDDGYARGYYLGIDEGWYGKDWDNEKNVTLLVENKKPLANEIAYNVFGTKILNFFSYCEDMYQTSDCYLTGEVNDGIFPRIKKDRSCHHNSFGYV